MHTLTLGKKPKTNLLRVSNLPYSKNELVSSESLQPLLSGEQCDPPEGLTHNRNVICFRNIYSNEFILIDSKETNNWTMADFHKHERIWQAYCCDEFVWFVETTINGKYKQFKPKSTWKPKVKKLTTLEQLKLLKESQNKRDS